MRDCSVPVMGSCLTHNLQSQTRQRNRFALVYVRLAIRHFGQHLRYAETVRIPLLRRYSVQTLLRFAVFRGVIRAFQQTAPSSLTASSLCCLYRSKPLRFHYDAHLVSAAGLARISVLQMEISFGRASENSHLSHQRQYH